ncbi:zinc finger lsd1 subclass family protein (macronuclear) [Tetrahymena thermophila SB210]|uniref:Zinc finger lsd1 subclass family protein n=1 Tax=Tetrahymena thermophila (strain SB210) TaxID=312017 RepID=I7LW00_TETTS|nr:zinc finger lsd1 subclass family protein [Tetrahymena thermophila SB210]EAS00424.2 zinc finger lsd1 subclass family protein [Tetrahymena thermophila SB210]|eukprot:XP_001020669.2 zinc finger lsd1 subclass family protein [Tetrahymena thermophila SB210]
MTVIAATQSNSFSQKQQFYCNNNLEQISLNVDLTYATQVLVYLYTNNVSSQLLVGFKTGYFTCQMPSLQIDMICNKNEYFQASTNQCVVCDQNCSKCNSQGQCLDCIQGYYIKNNICISNNQYFIQQIPLNCLKGYQLNNQNECVSCPTSGQLCTLSQADQYINYCNYNNYDQFNDLNCSQCNNGYLMNQICVSQCPIYYQPDIQNINCQSIGINNCIQTQNKLCVKCDSTSLIDSSQNCIKIICTSNCATCQYINSNNVCILCNSGYYLQDNQCVANSNCQNNIVTKKNVSICQICDPSYFQINSDKTCTLKQYYYLVQQNGIFLPQSCSQCLYQDQCPECQVSSSCLVYSNQNTCLYCNTNYIVDNNGQCQQKSSFISEYNQIVDYCIEYDSTSTKCASCLVGYYVSSNGQCLQCLYKLSDTNACAFTCPSGYYTNSSTYDCQKCQDSNCSVCDSTLICQTCNQNFHLYNSVCYQDQCLSNQYRDDQNQICQNCYYRCATCNEQGISGYFYNGNEDSDLKNSSVDISKCQACDSSCKECQGTATNCTVCQYTLMLNSQNKCVETCPKGYYQDTTTFQCVLCSDVNCNTCNSSLVCTYCNSGYVLTPQQICSNACQTGYYNQNQICQQCQTYCSSCLSLNNCLICEQNYDLINGQCDQKCSKSQYRDQQTLKCMQCDSSCLTCNGPLNINCLSCSPKLTMSSIGKCTICDEGEFYQKNEQQDIQNDTIDYLSCKKCDSSCQYCNGLTKYDCVTCMSGLFYDQINKICTTKSEIESEQSQSQECQDLQIQTQSLSDCESELGQIDLLSSLNQINTIGLVSGGFFLSLFVPQIGCMMWSKFLLPSKFLYAQHTGSYSGSNLVVKDIII